MLQAFKALNEMGVTHRGVRPSNMYWSGSDKSTVMLSEAVSAPAGHDQPGVFETVENAMAVPAGRSAGSTKNDLYASAS